MMNLGIYIAWLVRFHNEHSVDLKQASKQRRFVLHNQTAIDVGDREVMNLSIRWLVRAQIMSIFKSEQALKIYKAMSPKRKNPLCRTTQSNSDTKRN